MTRTRILDAVHQLMEQRHGPSVRMQDVATIAGVSRQAVYDHFGSRANLIMETIHYVDQVKGLVERKRDFDSADSGLDKLESYIEFWGNFIPEIYGLACALLADRQTDPAAAAAWDDRMAAVRRSCQIIVDALRRDNTLRTELPVEEAVDMLWTLLSIHNWEYLTRDCGWNQEKYIARMRDAAVRLLTDETARE